MKARRWKTKIENACRDAGTYRSFFSGTISTLATIMEKRDDAYKKWEEEGFPLTAEYTNKSGATNTSEHPLYAIWSDLEKTALTYWRDLGLTPAGLKKINEKAMQKKKESGLAAALRELSG